MKKGFTLVELVIVIVIVGILSIVAVPIYKGYVEKAQYTEGKALASAIRTAQQVYYAEHGAYYTIAGLVDYDPILQIDARGNKYFKTFRTIPSTVNAAAWTAEAYNSLTKDDFINLYWNIDNSVPATIAGYRLPLFRRRIKGKFTYTNS